jgi:hypothetical protein
MLLRDNGCKPFKCLPPFKTFFYGDRGSMLRL